MQARCAGAHVAAATGAHEVASRGAGRARARGCQPMLRPDALHVSDPERRNVALSPLVGCVVRVPGARARAAYLHSEAVILRAEGDAEAGHRDHHQARVHGVNGHLRQGGHGRPACGDTGQHATPCLLSLPASAEHHA